MSSQNKGSRKQSSKRKLDFEENSKDVAAQHRGVVDLTAGTPSKKKKRDLNDFFGSPVATNSIRSSSAAAIVTPPEVITKPKLANDNKEQGQDETSAVEAGYVPVYLNKNVSFLRKGECALDPQTKKVFELVEKHYNIPDGYENDRKFGPKSGVSFEQRVITSYCNNLLKPKVDEGEVEICTSCAVLGHTRDDCPELL